MNTSTASNHLTHHYLNQITKEHRLELVRFGTRRLARVREHLPDDALVDLTGEDLVHDALAAAVAGVNSPRHGRHPGAGSLINLDTFLHWLRSCMNSQLDNARVSAAAQSRRVSVEQAGHLAQPVAPLDAQAVLAALREEFAGQPDMLHALATWARCLHQSGPATPLPPVLQAAARRLLQPEGPTF